MIVRQKIQMCFSHSNPYVRWANILIFRLKANITDEMHSYQNLHTTNLVIK